MGRCGGRKEGKVAHLQSRPQGLLQFVLPPSASVRLRAIEIDSREAASQFLNTGGKSAERSVPVSFFGPGNSCFVLK